MLKRVKEIEKQAKEELSPSISVINPFEVSIAFVTMVLNLSISKNRMP